MKSLTPLEKLKIREDYLSYCQILPNKINKVLRVVGVGLVGIGVLTWFIPFITLPLISSGLLLCGITLKQVQQLIFVITYKLKNKVFFKPLQIKLRIWFNK